MSFRKKTFLRSNYENQNNTNDVFSLIFPSDNGEAVQYCYQYDYLNENKEKCSKTINTFVDKELFQIVLTEKPRKNYIPVYVTNVILVEFIKSDYCKGFFKTSTKNSSSIIYYLNEKTQDKIMFYDDMYLLPKYLQIYGDIYPDVHDKIVNINKPDSSFMTRCIYNISHSGFYNKEYPGIVEFAD
ncbi:hypothetical protein [Neodiprion sertifer nucleopolyhedrovirus]|uniref:Uncharacterized protein n=1 Tax=Neodiprion sertifer nucleopolyhedrovirus TaxID=111874 RepID=Q6JKA6_9CBAC|nr:hypothetical protein NeseNPV_gp54 [Neodiprion sertifer nucleopolyhedrovirus]AAQ96431.1 hypothetical protein [Neodiprion sertifer nucleopolyhedrovirus]